MEEKEKEEEEGVAEVVGEVGEDAGPEDEFQRAAPVRKTRLFAFDWAQGFVSPYRPADVAVVEGVLELVGPTPADVVFDLGSGDGRFLLAFAGAIHRQLQQPRRRQHKQEEDEEEEKEEEPHAGPAAMVVGYELDEALVSLSCSHVQSAGLSHLVEVRKEDLMQADFSPATIIIAYLLPDALRSLIPKMLEFLNAPAGAATTRAVVTIGWPLPNDHQTDPHLATHLVPSAGSTEEVKAQFAAKGFYIYGRRPKPQMPTIDK